MSELCVKQSTTVLLHTALQHYAVQPLPDPAHRKRPGRHREPQTFRAKSVST